MSVTDFYPDDFFIYRWRQQHGGFVALADRGWRGKPATDPIHAVKGGWNVAMGFPDLDSAVSAAIQFRIKHRVLSELQVWQGSVVVWSSVTSLSPINPQEEHVSLNIDGPGDIDQPLHIPRVDLISTLQSNLDAEKAEREKAQQAITTRRFAAQEAVATLSADELLNLVQKYVTTDLDDIVSFVEEAGKSGRLKSQPQPAGPKETALEKYVRVLGLANDETIEVKPNNPIYPLL